MNVCKQLPSFAPEDADEGKFYVGVDCGLVQKKTAYK